MGLTESKIRDLQDKKFDSFYDKNHPEYETMTSDAYNSARDYICGGASPRPDDVLKMLLPMLETNEHLRKYQENVHARAPRYREAFGEFIIDKHFAAKAEEEQK